MQAEAEKRSLKEQQIIGEKEKRSLEQVLELSQVISCLLLLLLACLV